MKLGERIEAFSALGEIIRDSLDFKGPWKERFSVAIEKQQFNNPWFTPGNVRLALSAIGNNLTTDNLHRWCNNYPGLSITDHPVKVAVIMAGNIPLAGFHDFLSVLISGNTVIIRKSSKDPDLILLLSEIVNFLSKELGSMIISSGDKLSDFDAVIATGSDNTSRYFEYYFGKYPNIIRRNRNSIAILDGSESSEELTALGTDIFSYFGLGCRNISKLYLPQGYDLAFMTEKWSDWKWLTHHSKYANNYDYNKAVYLVNRKKFTDAGFLLLTEEKSLPSPVGVLHIEYYDTPEFVENHINILRDRIQCISGKKHIPLGKAQYPELWDYADGTDTLEFLLKKKRPGIL